MSLGRARRHEEVLDARTCESPEDICNHFRASRTLIEIQYTFGRAMYAYGNSRNEIYLTTRASLPLSLSLSRHFHSRRVLRNWNSRAVLFLFLLVNFLQTCTTVATR